MSKAGSAPTTSASKVRRSRSVTVMELARETTCSLVRMMPSERMMTPEPSELSARSRSRGPPKNWRQASSRSLPRRKGFCDTVSAPMLTTAGPARSTTSTTAVRRPSAEIVARLRSNTTLVLMLARGRSASGGG